jgi:hypothetical protein
MAEQKSAARNPSRVKRGNGGQPTDEVSSFEHELAEYLQDRIKPGLNRGAIPLLARSIAKEIAHREVPAGADDGAEGDEDEQQASAEPSADDAEDRGDAQEDEDSGEDSGSEPSAEQDEAPDFEADMHDLQSELGEHWIVRFSVQGDDAWLTAEMDDGSQRIEAPTAAVLAEAVGLLSKAGGRSG